MAQWVRLNLLKSLAATLPGVKVEIFKTMVNIQSSSSFAGKLPLMGSAFAKADPAERLRGLLGVFLIAVMAIGAVSAGAKFLNDPDTLWHIAVGQDIWLSESFPHVDAYSHSFAGEPWIAKEWLSQLILYAAFVAGGWNGVAMLAIAVGPPTATRSSRVTVSAAR